MDLGSGPALSAETARAIVDAMKVVACADGALHEREMAIVEELERELPEGTEPGTIADDASRDALLTSLVMVALADGKVSAEEDRVIRNLASENGIPESRVTERIDEVKRLFIAQFAGVRIFRESVEQIAAELGVELKS